MNIIPYVNRPAPLAWDLAKAIFGATGNGTWLHPADLSTVFQDAAGTRPGAAGSPLGLELDKHLGGAGDDTKDVYEIQTFGTPAQVAVYDPVTGVGSVFRTDGSNSSGVRFLLSSSMSYQMDVENTGAATLRIVTSVSGTPLHVIAPGGRLKAFVTGRSAVALDTNGTSQGTSFVVHSLREVPGLHASQATTSARPTLVRMPKTGRRNALLWSEDLTKSPWNFTNASGGASQSGNTLHFGTNNLDRIIQNVPIAVAGNRTMTVRMSGSGSVRLVWYQGNGSTGGAQAITLTETPTDYTVTANITTTGNIAGIGILNNASATPSTVTVHRAQFEDGSEATPYQRVTNAFDVHEDGVPDIWYWQGDGTDDKLTLTLASAFTGYIFIAGTKGSILEPVTFSAGAVDLGPLTYTGGTPGIFNAIGGIVGVVLLDRALTEDEQTELVEYYKGKGAKGLLVEGPELVPGDFSEFADFSEAAAAGWVNGSAGAGSVDIMGDRLVILNVGDGANMGRAYHSFSAQSGSSFVVRATLAAAVSTRAKRCAINASTSWPPSPYLINSTGTSTGSHKFAYQASSTATHYIHFFNQDTDAVKGEWSNVSVRELRPQEDWA